MYGYPSTSRARILSERMFVFAVFACSGGGLFSKTSGNPVAGKNRKVWARFFHARRVYGDHGTRKR